MKKISSIFFCYLIGFSLNAQSVKRPVAAPYTGLGAYSRNQADAFSITSNQAALARAEHISAGVYGERRFLTGATDMYTGLVVVPTQKGNFAFQADYFGNPTYRESQLGIAYARSLGALLDIGVKFNHYSFNVPGYESSMALNFEIGVITRLTEQLQAGVHLYNPSGGYLSKTRGDKLGSVYTFGLGYDVGKNFMVSAEMIKFENLPVNIHAGIQYHFSKQFFARMGLSTENETPYAGAGLSWNDLRLDVSASFHPQLGISPGLMLIINLKYGKLNGS